MQASDERKIGRIPIRNIWLLMLYASDLVRFEEARKVLAEDADGDVPDLVARLLTDTVEFRLRRNLTRGFMHTDGVLTRVRGRIDLLATDSRRLLLKGQVRCRFEELTTDTPRNRLVRSALEHLAPVVKRQVLAQKCRSLAWHLARAGVSGTIPGRAEIAKDQIGRNDSADRLLVALANLAFQLVIPTEIAGDRTLVAPGTEEKWMRRLFEKAVLGFARFELEPKGWRVRGGTPLSWPVTLASKGLSEILPGMVTDIILDGPSGERVVIDTKFTAILVTSRYREDTLKSGYLYQMYTYLRSQEDSDPGWESAYGLLLHPTIGKTFHE
jgi:5-methylcytosine-specific restriction enzyme subunit McrC